MNFYNKLSNIGAENVADTNVKRKIILSNQLAFFSCTVVIPYIVFYFFVYPPMAIFYIVIIVFTLGVIYLNSQKMYNLAKIMLTLLPILAVYISSSFIVAQTTQNFPTGIMMLLFALSLIGFLFFNLTDILNWIVILPIIGLILMFPEFIIGIFTKKNIDLSILLSDTMDTVYRVTSLLVTGIIMYLFMNNIQNSEKANLLFLEEINLKNAEQALDKENANAYIKQIEESQVLEKEREWASAGVVKFSEILRETIQDESNIYDKIIVNLVKYIEANQAAIFIIEEENDKEVLILKGCYAYNRKKYLHKSIEIGEGLIGQCVLEKDTIFLTDIPQNYLNITSGLGNAQPGCILIQPLIVNEKVFGVIELASFEILPPAKRNFIAKVGETLASTISSIKTNEKTKTLLAISMQQTEEMRAQEEEMRQNMEELNATQEEMQRKEKAINEMLEISKNKEQEAALVSLQIQADYEILHAKYEKLTSDRNSKEYI